MQTRRNILKMGSSLLPLGLRRSTIGGLATALTLASNTPAKAQWETALMAAQTTLSVLAAFSQSDGGLAAMLGAHTAMLQLISEQLNQIQLQLGSLTIAVQNLEPKFRAAIAENYRDTLINGISAAAGSYKEILDASIANPSIFDEPPVQVRLSTLAQHANTNRNTLAVISEGYGPETALVVPVACALEIACSAKVGFKSDLLISILRSYKQWLTNMLADRPGSILRYRQQAVLDHITNQRNASETRLGKIFKVASFDIEAQEALPKRNDGEDYCVVFSQVFAPSGNEVFPKKKIWSAFEFAASLKSMGVTYVDHSASLNLERVEALGAGQYSFSNGLTVVSWGVNGELKGYELPDDSQCYGRSNPAIFNRDAAIAYSRSKAAKGDFEVELISFNVFLAGMNLARGRVGLADKAMEIVRATETQVDRQIALLEGR
jgi:hypothetical protein